MLAFWEAPPIAGNIPFDGPFDSRHFRLSLSLDRVGNCSSLRMVGWSLYGHFLFTRANQTGTHCLKWTPNHYEQPHPDRESNPAPAAPKARALTIQPTGGPLRMELTAYLECLRTTRWREIRSHISTIFC